jgi:hypothetical protein
VGRKVKETPVEIVRWALTFLPTEEWQLYDKATLALDDIESELEKTTTALREAQLQYYVFSLEWAITLAESDPFYAEVFRPYFRRIEDALVKGAGGK